MRILALETTEKAGGVAVLEDRNLLAWHDLASDERSATALAPAIKNILHKVGWKLSDADLIAVAVGPGSFTGLRVGIATAKTLAYVGKCSVLGANTLQVIAYGVDQAFDRLHVWIDAQREQVFSAAFRCRPGEVPEWIEPARIVDQSLALAKLKPGDAVVGPALTKLSPRLPAQVIVVNRSCWSASATCIGQLAARLYAGGQRDDLWQLSPLYLRLSAAEEKWAREDGPK